MLCTKYRGDGRWARPKRTVAVSAYTISTNAGIAKVEGGLLIPTEGQERLPVWCFVQNEPGMPRGKQTREVLKLTGWVRLCIANCCFDGSHERLDLESHTDGYKRYVDLFTAPAATCTGSTDIHGIPCDGPDPFLNGMLSRALLRNWIEGDEVSSAAPVSQRGQSTNLAWGGGCLFVSIVGD